MRGRRCYAPALDTSDVGAMEPRLVAEILLWDPRGLSKGLTDYAYGVEAGFVPIHPPNLTGWRVSNDRPSVSYKMPRYDARAGPAHNPGQRISTICCLWVGIESEMWKGGRLSALPRGNCHIYARAHSLASTLLPCPIKG